jgi:hypothetical protein
MENALLQASVTLTSTSDGFNVLVPSGPSCICTFLHCNAGGVLSTMVTRLSQLAMLFRLSVAVTLTTNSLPASAQVKLERESVMVGYMPQLSSQ